MSLCALLIGVSEDLRCGFQIAPLTSVGGSCLAKLPGGPTHGDQLFLCGLVAGFPNSRIQRMLAVTDTKCAASNPESSSGLRSAGGNSQQFGFRVAFGDGFADEGVANQIGPVATEQQIETGILFLHLTGTRPHNK